MSGFSADWLALREPADQRSRSAERARALEQHFAGRSPVAVVDLGCGTGSNLRGTFAHLPAEQLWTLVDYDPVLLAAARVRLAAWAERSKPDGDGLRLEHAGRAIRVRFRQVDLNAADGIAAALGERPDLVTASAFFDLCSGPFIERFAHEVALRRAAFFTVLTYNGDQRWLPAHPDDPRMATAFHAHQRTDKGFGAAAGPDAPAVLARAFRAFGYAVSEGDSPWLLGPADQRLVSELASGFADAAGELGAEARATAWDWRSQPRVGAIVGHTDTLALPAVK